jgi:hypothetical protein
LRAWEAARYEGGGEAVFGRVFLEEIYPKLLSWPKYLLTYRDLEGSGLVTIYHPWESGTDNFQRWDAALVAVEPDERRLPPYPRRDLQYVDDPSERLSAAEYDRYCGCWSR